MTGIIVYGSLMDINETMMQGLRPIDAVPIRLKGYRRSFNLKPSWRKGSGRSIAVLNVEYCSGSWINGVCLLLESGELAALDTRERGYNREGVPAERLECYLQYDLPDDTPFFIYIGKEEKIDSQILPNKDYLDVCMAGASSWGEDFFDEFVATTYLASGESLNNKI
jgi:hypothetical protein